MKCKWRVDPALGVVIVTERDNVIPIGADIRKNRDVAEAIVGEHNNALRLVELRNYGY